MSINPRTQHQEQKNKGSRPKNINNSNQRKGNRKSKNT